MNQTRSKYTKRRNQAQKNAGKQVMIVLVLLLIGW